MIGQVRPINLQHRLVRMLEGHAKVKAHDAAQPGEILLPDRLVEAVKALRAPQAAGPTSVVGHRPTGPPGHAMHKPEGDATI